MLEGLPWPAQIGVTGAGYVGFVVVCLRVVHGYISGATYPASAVKELQRRNAAQEKAIADLTASNTRLTESLELTNALVKNLNTAVEGAKEP